MAGYSAWEGIVGRGEAYATRPEVRKLAFQRGSNVNVDVGGERGPVAPAVFKTVMPPNGGGWVRLPFTSAISGVPS